MHTTGYHRTKRAGRCCICHVSSLLGAQPHASLACLNELEAELVVAMQSCSMKRGLAGLGSPSADGCCAPQPLAGNARAAAQESPDGAHVPSLNRSVQVSDVSFHVRR